MVPFRDLTGRSRQLTHAGRPVTVDGFFAAIQNHAPKLLRLLVTPSLAGYALKAARSGAHRKRRTAASRGSFRNRHRRVLAVLYPSFAASQRSRSHPTGTQVRSFLSHLFAPRPAPRPHREAASGD